VYLIAIGKTVRLASSYSLIVLVVLASARKDSRLGVVKFINTLIDGANSAVVVAIPCAVAGIIVGILSYTSLGLMISQEISKMAGNRLWLALVLAMVLVIIMGMGMPRSAAYIMSATLLAPALKKIGVPLIVAHFYIFYFANLSMITPPVALASYTAAGVAKTPFWDTGIEAFKYSFITFLIPYVFVYNPALLGTGSAKAIILAVIPAIIGLWSVAVGMIGFLRAKIGVFIRILLVLIGLLMIIPEKISTIAGIACFAVFLVWQLAFTKNTQTY